jgi:hypothetical protein
MKKNKYFLAKGKIKSNIKNTSEDGRVKQMKTKKEKLDPVKKAPDFFMPRVVLADTKGFTLSLGAFFFGA